VAWLIIDQMNPDKAALVLATVEVDIGRPARPVAHRQGAASRFSSATTPDEIEAAAGPLSELKDTNARTRTSSGTPADDQNRSAKGKETG
jgi:hypothetical protein